jgi:hypothetical protein
MRTHAMNHQQAIDEHATERYLLREMTPHERRAFEEHYLECAECLEAVTFGAEFLDAGREVVREEKQELASPAVTSWRERLLPALSGWLRPAPVLAFALVLAIAGIGYQGFRIHRLISLQEAKVARPEFRYMLTGIAHGGSEAKLVQVPRDSIVSLQVEYNRSGEYVSYRAAVVSESGTLKQSITLPDIAGDMANVAVLPGILQNGNYQLIIFGRTADGAEKEVGRGAFVLDATNK